MLHDFWNLEIQLLPVVATLFLAELPGLIRRFKRLYYVPIYFSVFPFRELNRDLSRYLGDDYFHGDGPELSQEELSVLQKKIVRLSIISMTLSVVVTPALSGFISAFFLPRSSFAGFVILFIVYKLIGLIQSAMSFCEHAVGTKRNILAYGVIYLVYFGCFITIFEISYDWASPFIAAGDYLALWKEIRMLVFGKIIVLGLIVALLSGVATSLITDRKLREQLRSERK